MNSNLAAKAINYVAVSSALTKKALDEISLHRDAQTKAASLRPALVQRMLDTGCITVEEKTAAEAMRAQPAWEWRGAMRRPH